MSQDSGQLRRPPAERFAGSTTCSTCPRWQASCEREDHPAADGHRQMTLFHAGDLTLVLFDFEAAGVLADHEADGYVTIHTVAGELEVSTSEATHRLSRRVRLVLAPGVRHDVTGPGRQSDVADGPPRPVIGSVSV